jgi:hypothetical protein
MKDKFRIKFCDYGWIVEHSRLGIFWLQVGMFTFRKKSDAEKVANDLREGISNNVFFDDDE